MIVIEKKLLNYVVGGACTCHCARTGNLAQFNYDPFFEFSPAEDERDCTLKCHANNYMFGYCSTKIAVNFPLSWVNAHPDLDLASLL